MHYDPLIRQELKAELGPEARKQIRLQQILDHYTSRPSFESREHFLCETKYGKEVLVWIEKRGESPTRHFGLQLYDLTKNGGHAFDLILDGRLLGEEAAFLDRIDSVYISEGFGTVAMDLFLSYCREHGVKWVGGLLTTSDLASHEDRLVSFYGKYGFQITIDRFEKKGRIKLDLEPVSPK